MRAVRRAKLAGFVALAALLALASWLLWPARSAHAPHPLAHLAAAVGPALPFEARLTGGFRPRDGSGVMRSASGPPSLSPDARIAIAELEKRTIATPAPDLQAALGVAYLVQGDVDRAIATLEDVAASDPRAPPLSDLSAAYLAKAARVPSRRVEYLARSFDAAAKSLRIASTNEARFNRALALDALRPFVGDTGAWTEYVKVESDPAWVAAATRHLADDRPIDDPLARWQARRKELGDRLAARDRAFVVETVKEFPEGSIEYFEQVVTVDWAKAVLSGDGPAARAQVERARMLGGAIRDATGDPMYAGHADTLHSGVTALARGHLAYVAGQQQYRRDQHGQARASYDTARAAFSARESAYSRWADLEIAQILFHQRDLPAADSRLAAVESYAEARGYRTMLGRTLWLRGLVHSTQWRLTEAIGAARRAASAYEAAGQRENIASVNNHLADTLRALGDQHQSWDHIGRTLEALPGVRSPLRRYLFLYNATLFASRQDLLETALLFQNATVREAAKASPGVSVDALTQRAIVQMKRGDRAAASQDVQAAVGRLPEVPPGGIKSYLQAELDVISAQLDRATGETSAVDRLTSALRFFEKAEPARVPRLFLSLGRAQLAGGLAPAAEASLQRGIETLERQQSAVGDEALRISYFDEAWELFGDMMALQLSVRRDPQRAFEFAERSRGRLLASPADRNVGLDAIRAALPPSAVMVYYATLPDRLLTWTMSAASAPRLVEAPIAEAELVRLVTRHRAALVDGRESAANDRLYELLVQPVAAALTPESTIVLAPGGALQQLPFATLRSRRTGRYLVEDHVLVTAPSARFFASGSVRRHSAAAHPLRSALLFGNPVTSEGASLPGAEAEVAEAARHYADGVVLTGRSATRAQFLEKAPGHDVVHFGGHAFANAEYPLLSRLSFAGEAGAEQSLFAHEIAGMDFARTRLVVLAACSTGVGALSRGEGAVSIARPFLQAGVPLVIASQWDVDDRATSRLFVTFHQELTRTADPAGALRSAQLALLRSEDAHFAHPASWGAFAALGTTVR